MKIEVAKQDLEYAISVVSLAVGPGNDLYSHFLFRTRNGKAEINSDDGVRLFAGCPLISTFEGDEGDAFTVEAWRLVKWMDGAKDGVLSLTFDGKGVEAKDSSGRKIRMRTLDPKKWRHNDALLDSATSVGSVEPQTLSRALALARWFVSPDDSSKPELCQIEAKDGVLWSTDRRALTSVVVKNMDDLNIRVPGKDAAAVIRFLNDKAAGDTVEIKEAERPLDEGGGGNASFWRADGSYLGVVRPTNAFPTLNVDREAEDDAKLILDVPEFKAALNFLSAGAPKGHDSVTFKYDPNEGPEGTVTLQMPCEEGGENGVDNYAMSLAKVLDGKSKWEKDFTVGMRYIQGIGDTFGLETLEFGVNARGRGGFISFRYQNEDDPSDNDYYSVIVWKT